MSAPHRRTLSMCRARVLGGLLGSPALLARDDVGGVPPRPVVLRSGRFVRAMVLLCLSQKLCQRRDVQAAESSSGKPRLDLLEQPAVAVWIAERGARAVGAPDRDPALARVPSCRRHGVGRRNGTPRSRRHRVRRARRARPRCRRRRGNVPCTEPGAAVVTPLPNWIEHGEPGGVICTARQSSPAAKSASSRHPRLW